MNRFLFNHSEKVVWTLVLLIFLWIAGCEMAKSAPPILFNVSHRSPVPELVAKTWSTHAAVRKAVTYSSTLHMASQQRPRLWDDRFNGRWSQILAVRDGTGKLVISGPDGSPVLLPSGHRDMTITPEHIYRLARNRLTRHPSPPAMVIIDEITANTADEIAQFLHYVNRDYLTGDPVAIELRSRLAFFVVGGDDVRPQSFPAVIKRFLRKTKRPVYAEIYGGKMGKDPNTRIAVNARMQGIAIRWMHRMGWNVRPMVSAKHLHIGWGPGSVKALKWRIDAVIRNVGMRPAVWHLNGGRSPAARGLARLVLQTASLRYRPTRLTPYEQREIREMAKMLHRQRAK